MTFSDAAKALLKPHVDPATWARLRRWVLNTRGRLRADDLTALATLYGSDKWNGHWYAQHYQHHFAPLRHKPINLLEIGVGGYADSQAGGESLRMWKRFFPYGQIYSIDIHDKSPLQEARIAIFQGSQADPDFLRGVARRMGRLDIVVDDGSHINEHVGITFETLFPLLAEGGIYAIEDTQTSYWPSHGGSEDLSRPGTTMNRLKSLADGLNYEEFLTPGYQQTLFDRTITSMHFYHNLVVIHKGVNAEGSNVPDKVRKARERA